MAAEVDELAGPKGKHDPERQTVRHGNENRWVTLGGHWVRVSWPRVRSANGREEAALKTYLALGVTCDGDREVLGILVAANRRRQVLAGRP